MLHFERLLMPSCVSLFTETGIGAEDESRTKKHGQILKSTRGSKRTSVACVSAIHGHCEPTGSSCDRQYEHHNSCVECKVIV
jgi:hypothetical protein